MKNGSEMIDVYLDHLRLERRLSPRTVESYRADLIQHIEYLKKRTIRKWSDVDTEMLRRDLARLHKEGRARRSLQRYRSSLRGFYRFMHQERMIDTDPVQDLEGPRSQRSLPGCLSIREIKRILKATEGSEPLDLRDRAMIEVAYGAGLRVSELIGLGPEEIDLENRWVRVRGKGDRERVVPIGTPACSSVREFIEQGRPHLGKKKQSARLFLNRRGTPLSRMGFFRVLRKRGEAAGLDPTRLHPHLLRHSFATHLLQAGASLRVVQELLGHSSMSTTEIYTAVDRSYLQKIHRRHHPRGGVQKGGTR